MTELNPKIKEALIRIDFIKRYEALSHKYASDRTPSAKRLVYIDGEEVMETIAGLGYKPLFDTKEKFFKIKEEQAGNLAFGFHIILRDGSADLVWVVKENGELLLGSPWSLYSRLIINPDYKIMPPFFSSYEDLDDIFYIVFKMYADFKKTMTAIQ